VAFDRLAPVYDDVAGGDAFRRQREQSHAALARWLSPGMRALEIGCGTGIDTVFLARRGLHVVACDPSEEMVRRAAGRAAQDARLRSFGASAGRAPAGRVVVLTCGLQELPDYLDTLDDGGGFDAIVSNFGALNCVESLEPLGVVAARHLRPGGAAMLVLIGRTCAWEDCYAVVTGRHSLMGRRRQSRALVPVAGVDVPTFYHRTSDLGRALGADFSLDQIVGLGIAVPPPYLEARWRQVPRALRALASRFDRLAGAWPPFSQLGDHVLTRWLKRRDADPHSRSRRDAHA
jgi:SAM-dependent methyltransferase